MRRLWLWVILFAVTLCATGCLGRPSDSTPKAEAANTPSSSGNTCTQIAGQMPDTAMRVDTAAQSSWRRAFARGADYRCVIHPTIPPVRVVIVGDSTGDALDSLLIVPDAPRAVMRERFTLESEMPLPWNTDVVRMLDLDADGYNDLLVGSSWGATGNTAYHVWRFNPRERRFVADRQLSELFNPSPVSGAACVQTHSNSSVADNETALLCLRHGRWITDSSETNAWDRDAHVIVHEIRARRGDTLVVVKRTVRPDSLS